MKIKCAVACRNSNGEPDLFFVTVECSEKQYEEGDHYRAAISHANEEGCESFLAYDENDPAGPALMEHAVWESMDLVSISS